MEEWARAHVPRQTDGGPGNKNRPCEAEAMCQLDDVVSENIEKSPDDTTTRHYYNKDSK